MPMRVPNVRVIAVCDEAVPSDEEAEVFTLANTRFYVAAEAFPHTRTLHVYLQLFCDQPGDYTGAVTVRRNHDWRVVRYARFQAVFDGSWEYIALRVDLGDCMFPDEGHYALNVTFMDEDLEEHTRADSRIILVQMEE